MHKGFYFVGDNVDLRTKVQQMTMKNQNKDQHMFPLCAYKNRISGNNLDNTKPKDNIETVEFRNFVPSVEESEKLADELSFHVASHWVESKKISNDQELRQSDPTSCPQNQKGNN